MPTNEVVLKKIEPQLVASIRDVIHAYGDQRPLWQELATYLGQHGAKAAGPPLTIYYDPEYRERDVDVETATPVSVPLPSSERITVRELLGIETMACIIHQGSYDTFSQTYVALMTWIETNGYRIVGPNQEVYLRCMAGDYEDPTIYVEYVTADPAEYVTEIQFPVEKA